MSCTVTADGTCRRTLSFQVEREQLDGQIESALGEIARTTELKGFRKGKAPLDVVRRLHGESVREEARRRVMSESLSEAVREHELHPVGEPEMNLEVYLDDGKGPFTFEFTLEVMPDFELADLSSIPVEVALPPVTDDMIEAQVTRLLEQSASIANAEEGATVGDDDILHAGVTYTVEGLEIEPRTERPVFLRHDLVDGIAIEGAKAAFAGKQVGDTVELETTLPEHFADEEARGKVAKLSVTIEKHQLMELPELDEELCKRFGVEDEADLRTRIREQLDAQRDNFRGEQIDREVQTWLLDKHELELPERLAAKAVDRRVHEYAHQLIEQQGVSSEDGHHQAEERREEIAAASRDALKASFILSRIAKENELSATVVEAENQIRALAASQGEDPEQVVANARSEGWMSDMVANLTEQKTREFLRTHAQVTEKEPVATPDGDA